MVLDRDRTAQIFGVARSGHRYVSCMTGVHEQRAVELAEEAGRAVEAALSMTSDVPSGGWSNYAGTGRESAERVMWERVRALQAQAQIHATLALNETIASDQRVRG